MAIYIQPTDTQPGLTLMGRILSGPINYRVGYGFKKRNPQTGPGRVRVFAKTRSEPELEPNPTCLYIYVCVLKVLKYPHIYIYKL